MFDSKTKKAGLLLAALFLMIGSFSLVDEAAGKPDWNVKPFETHKPFKTYELPEPYKLLAPHKLFEPVKPIEPVKLFELVKPIEPVKLFEPVKPIEPVKLFETYDTTLQLLQVNAQTPSFDLASKKDQKTLSRLRLDRFTTELDDDELSSDFKAAFCSNDRTLSGKARVSTLEKGWKWKIYDGGTTYIVKKEGIRLVVYSEYGIKTQTPLFRFTERETNTLNEDKAA